MASIYSLLEKMIILLKDTLDEPLNNEMDGLGLRATLPTRAGELPTIVISFAEVEKSVPGLGSIVVVKKEDPGKGIQVVKRDRIKGKIIFQTWIQKDTDNVLEEIEKAAALLNNQLEMAAQKNNNENNAGNKLRAQGLLKMRMVSIGPIETSENLPVWLIPPDPNGTGVALGKQLVYNFVYEDMEGEAEDDRIIEKIVVEPIKVDGNIVPENASVPADS